MKVIELTNELSWQFREQCEGTSTEWRRKLNLRVFDPLPANTLAREFKAQLYRPDQMDASVEAVQHLSSSTIWCGVILKFNPLMILYHPNLSPARYESTIMHELSHIILNHPPGHLYIASDQTFRREFNTHIEAEASYLGSCLQVPRRGLQWAIQLKMDVPAIASQFGASIELVRWRQNSTL